MKCDEVLDELRARSDPAAVDGMARYGIRTDRALGGTSVPELRKMAKRLGRDHELALELWATEVHEARVLAGMVDDPAQVTEAQAEAWAADFDSWDLCDQVCSNLFSRLPFAWAKCAEWATREEEYVRRAAFALMAALAVHDKAASDAAFERLLPLIKRAASDERNYVKKAVNWALRQIGKRSRRLNGKAIEAAEQIRAMSAPSARWIGADALRELTGEAVQARLRGQKPERPG